MQQLGKTDGFYKDPVVHIPLPKSLQVVKEAVGMCDLRNGLDLKLNRAADAATPKAKALFVSAINQMTFDDVMAIYKGAISRNKHPFSTFRNVSSPLGVGVGVGVQFRQHSGIHTMLHDTPAIRRL